MIFIGSGDDFLRDLQAQIDRDREYSKSMMTEEQLAIAPGDFVRVQVAEDLMVYARLYTQHVFLTRELAACVDDEEVEYTLRNSNRDFEHLWVTCNNGYALWRSVVEPEGEIGSQYRNRMDKITAEEFVDAVIKFSPQLSVEDFSENWDHSLDDLLAARGIRVDRSGKE